MQFCCEENFSYVLMDSDSDTVIRNTPMCYGLGPLQYYGARSVAKSYNDCKQ